MPHLAPMKWMILPLIMTFFLYLLSSLLHFLTPPSYPAP